MEQNKSEILSELYAIRATMSLVAQNEEKTKKANRQISGNCEGQKNVSQGVRIAKSKLESDITALRCDVVLESINAKIKDKKDELKHTMGARKSIFLAIGIFFAVVMIGGIAAAVIFGICYPKVIFLEKGGYNIRNINIRNVIIIGSVLVAVGLLSSIVVFFTKKQAKKYRAIRSEMKALQSEYKNTFALQKAGVTYIDAEKVQSLSTEFEEYVEAQNQIDDRLERKTSQLYQDIDTLKADSRALVHAAIEAFPVIDFRDWGNLDLLIYYFETGRADSVKEALQLVDRQLQADQITQAIETASKEIQRTVKDSIYRLGETMAMCFDRLSDQLATQHREAMISQTMTNVLLSQIASKSTDLYVSVNAQLN